MPSHFLDPGTSIERGNHRTRRRMLRAAVKAAKNGVTPENRRLAHRKLQEKKAKKRSPTKHRGQRRLLTNVHVDWKKVAKLGHLSNPEGSTERKARVLST